MADLFRTTGFYSRSVAEALLHFHWNELTTKKKRADVEATAVSKKRTVWGCQETG